MPLGVFCEWFFVKNSSRRRVMAATKKRHFATFDIPRLIAQDKIIELFKAIFDFAAERGLISPDDAEGVEFAAFHFGENHTVIMLYLSDEKPEDAPETLDEPDDADFDPARIREILSENPPEKTPGKGG
jgi:hypothetical protein